MLRTDPLGLGTVEQGRAERDRHNWNQGKTQQRDAVLFFLLFLSSADSLFRPDQGVERVHRGEKASDLEVTQHLL